MSKREWKFYIDDMIGFVNNVELYCEVKRGYPRIN